MTTAIQTKDLASEIETVVVNGNLAALSPEQRLGYYRAVCTSLGLNPLTHPFDYITLNGKLTLYARKDATDQIRNLNDVSIFKLERENINDVYVVTAYASNASGREDSSIGAVSIKGLVGDNLANAMMKAETKAKRRVTLSICGLGMMDETEIETTPAIKVMVDDRTGEILSAQDNHKPQAETEAEPQPSKVAAAMTIEYAEAEYSETEKLHYGEMSTANLAIRLNSMLKVKEKAVDQLRKIDAARVILDARNHGRSVQTALPAETIRREGTLL